MSNNAQPQASSGLDMFKWVLALAIVAVGVYGNNFYANDYSVLERTLVLLALAALALTWPSSWPLTSRGASSL